MTIDTPQWVRDAVFYQIFPDRFASSSRVAKPGPLEPWDAPPTRHGFKGGDLLGIVERLDYLDDLGVNALYLNPVFTSASNHRYHTDDYEHVDPLLGGDPALRELLDACHARGMHVILDGVFNHSGRGWFPFHHVVENGADSPYREWFYLDQERAAGMRPLDAYPDDAVLEEMRATASREGLHGGAASERFLGYRGWWDLPALPKIRVEHEPARAHLLDIAERWIRTGADGWRLDVPEEVDMGFWREFRSRVREADPQAYLVGEIWRVRPEWVAGDTFDALMDYPLAEALIGFVGGPSIDWGIVNAQDQYRDTVRPLDGAGFADELTRLLGAYDPAVTAVQLNLLGSHDTPRFVTVCGGDPAAYRLATVVQMTLPGAPCIYYGDEVGVEGALDPDCRRSFPADPSTWDEDRRSFVRGAIALRRAHPVLRHGETRILGAVDGAMAYLRSGSADGSGAARADESFVVAVNGGTNGSSLVVEVPEWAGATPERVALAGDGPGASGTMQVIDDRRIALEVPARDALIRPPAVVQRLATARCYAPRVADFSIGVDDADLRTRLEAVIDREDKIPRALEALGPVSGRRVVLLDADRGLRTRQLEALGARVSPLPGLDMQALPRGLADVVISFWAGFQGGGPETERVIAASERALRTGGRLLIVHDYGRDDISRLLADEDRERQQVAWSRRDGWFLLHDFKVRVLHCWWTFESLEEAHDLLVLAFGQAGTEVATSMRRPRLEYKVAVYHRTMGVDQQAAISA